MGRTELKDYNRDDLEEAEHEFAVGSYGDVKLLYDKKLNTFVVGKTFYSSGEMRKVHQDFANAKREAKILTQFEHKSIVAVLGATMWDKRSFTIILEYVPNGNLESLLMQDKDIPLPWKLRARFFTELSNALDYLHNHDPNRSYIHGDLKPQNVLLGDLLVIKLADFGAATINKYTGASTLAISGENNTQHTPFYTAPEFLKNPTKCRSQKMDVYSFGMIGYEILTTKAVYSGAGVSTGVVLNLILFEGQKPDETIVNEVENSLFVKTSNDSEIFRELNKIVKQSWETDPEDRPKIADIKKRLEDLAQSKMIYDKATDKAAKAVPESKKLQPTLKYFEERPKNTTATKQWFMLSILTILIFFVAFILNLMTNLDTGANLEAPHGNFLGTINGKLVKYNACIKNLSAVSGCHMSNALLKSAVQILQVKDMVYVFGHVWEISKNRDSFQAMKTNLRIHRWPALGKKFIGKNDTILEIILHLITIFWQLEV